MKDKNSADFIEQNFITRFLKSKWQFIELSGRDEVLLFTIDPSINPKWYSVVNFTPPLPTQTHLISFFFKEKCNTNKKYSANEIYANGNEVLLNCIDGDFLEFTFDGTGRRDLGVSVGGKTAKFEIDDKAQFLIQKTGNFNFAINKIACFK